MYADIGYYTRTSSGAVSAVSSAVQTQSADEDEDEDEDEDHIPDGSEWGVEKETDGTGSIDYLCSGANTHAISASDSGDGDGPKEEARVIEYEYHIVYSSTYKVPVLYFNAAHLDGTSLRGTEVWDILPKSIRSGGYDPMITVRLPAVRACVRACVRVCVRAYFVRPSAKMMLLSFNL